MEIKSTPVPISKGEYQLNVVIGTGTAQLQSSVEGQAAQDIPDASYSASTIEIITLRTQELSAVLTGDAQVFIGKAE